MNVVILHCHFRRGGVTQVVDNHVAALTDLIDGQIVLVSGGRNDGLSTATRERTKQLVIEGFDYDDLTRGECSRSDFDTDLVMRADRIAGRIATGLASSGFSSDDTVLHWHNHSLGKNVAAPLVIKTLAANEGFRQLLQIHDFAEDFRPENYLRLVQAAEQRGQIPFVEDDVNQFCYPNSPLVHYATLTSGDASVLTRLSIDDARIHLLPNCVTLGEDDLPDPLESLEKVRQSASLPSDARWCVYPVRGIRRKNVGEFLLLSRLLPDATYAGITLPPATPIEKDSYQRWREIGAIVSPKAIFDAGTFDGLSFHENLAASDFIVSTSVAEGFGMAFLEPWLADRGVIARRLPNVVNDFESAGVSLNRFYDSVAIPGDVTWIADCRRESSEAFIEAWQKLPDLYGQAWKVDQADPDRDPKTIDFATLTPRRQIEVLTRMSQDLGFENAIKGLNDGLVDWLSEPFRQSDLDQNRQLIASKYSLQLSGNRLISIYRGLVENQTCDSGQGESLAMNASVVEMICGERTYFPCRTEWEIAR